MMTKKLFKKFTGVNKRSQSPIGSNRRKIMIIEQYIIVHKISSVTLFLLNILH